MTMKAEDLVLCLSGEHFTLPELVVDTIKGNADLWSIVRAYGKGNATYESVSAKLAEFI